eukprot:gene9074-12238_t
MSRFSKSKLPPTICTAKSDLWTNWEYGTFSAADNHEHVLGDGKRSSKADQSWSILNDEEVIIGINALNAYCTPERMNRISNIINHRTSNIRMVFENPGNANNVWAALRTFDSFGIQFIDVIIDSETYTKEWRKGTMNTALGSQKWLTINEYSNTTLCLQALKNDGYTILATDVHDGSVDVNSAPWNENQKYAIIMGNEERGISNEVKKQMDGSFYIPMKGFAESLNLSVASAVICTVMNSKGVLTPMSDTSIKNRIQLTWMARTVSGSMAILRRAGLTSIVGNSVFNSIGKVTTKP